MLGLLILRPWWSALAPEGLQVPVGLLALVLGFGGAVWLQRKPALVSQRRRRGRLRERVQQQRSDTASADEG